VALAPSFSRTLPSLTSRCRSAARATRSTPAAVHNVETARQRSVTADQIVARLAPQLDKVEGAKLFMQVAQDLTVGGRASRTQYQYTLQGSIPTR